MKKWRKNSADRAAELLEEQNRKLGGEVVQKNLEIMEMYDDFDQYEDPMASLRQFLAMQ